MLLFGHRFIASKTFYHITDIDSIQKTPPSSILYMRWSEENLDVIEHSALNDIIFALRIKEITEIIYAAALGAHYIIVDPELAKSAQNIANNYLFDAKILVKIEEEEEIEEMALLGVDGVIFANAIIKVNS